MVNYGAEALDHVSMQLQEQGLPQRVMIDCSHDNCSKDYKRQALVCRDVATQIANGDERIIGVMLESNLVAGRQRLTPGKELVYGQSITDPCLGWVETLELLKELAAAVRAGRVSQAAQ